MRVLMQNRSTVQKVLAGDTIQMTKTREALLKMGIEVEISALPNPQLDQYDLVHLFNIIPIEETHRFYTNAKKQGIPIILSPIYWDPTEFLTSVQSPKQRSFQEWWIRTNHLRQEVLDGVDLLLPNALEEYLLLKEKFHIITPYRIIPNGVDPIFYYADPRKFVNRYGLKNFILSVGRICRRKNQRSLIRAARAFNKTVVLLGPINDFQYYQECRREGEGRVRFIDPLPETWIASAYAASDLHALVSWYDTPGLVSLEAALAGCKVVSTNRGTAREYLGEMVWYCSPDPDSIGNALQRALYTPKDPFLKEYVLTHFTWDRIASQTLEAYKEVIR